MELLNIADGTLLKKMILPFAGFAPPLILNDIMLLSGGYHSIQGYYGPPYYFAPCTIMQVYKLN